MGADNVFSQEELDSMSEEERQAIENELQYDSEESTEEQTTEGDETEQTTEEGTDEETAETEAQTEEEEAGKAETQESGDSATTQETDQQVTTEEQTKPEGQQDEQVQTDRQDQQTPERQSQEASDQEGQEGDKAQEQQDAGTEKKQELQEQLKSLREKFEEGEISFEDYLDQRDEVKDQIRELELTDKVRQELEQDRIEQTRQQLEQQWKKDQQAFFETNQDITGDSNLLNVFKQQANIKIQDPAYDNVANMDLLNEAAKEARAIRGVAAPNSNQQQQEGVAQARKRANAKSGGNQDVTTLSGVPNAAEQDTGESEFAYIDKLLEQGDTEKLEAELAKLTPEQEARYLRR